MIAGAAPVAGEPVAGNAGSPTAIDTPKYALKDAGAGDEKAALASYVKGAYNAVIKGINNTQDEIDTLNSGIETYSDAIGHLTDGKATKTGTVATIKSATTNESINTSSVNFTGVTTTSISATASGNVNLVVPIMDDWENDSLAETPVQTTASFTNLPVQNLKMSAPTTNTAKLTKTGITGNVDVSGYTISQHGKNLFNIATAIASTGITASNGEESPASSVVSASGYIPVFGGKEYTLNLQSWTTNTFGIAWYNINKEYISGQRYTGLAVSTYTAPANAYYARITVRTDQEPFQFEQGTTATAYEPYGGNTETINTHGKNLFDGQWQRGIYSTSTGAYSSISNRICNVNMIQVKPSTTYTVSCPDYALAGGMRWLFYDENKNFISAITTGTNTATTPSNAKYINFYIANNLTVDTAPDLQIEQGSTATAYEPYY